MFVSPRSSLRGISGPKSPQALEELERTSHLSKKELQALQIEYRKLSSRNGLMDLEAFRKSLGSLGLVQDALLCQRLFSVFNKSMTGSLTFEEFAMGLGCLTKGTVDEKLDFSFKMTDIDGSGEISFDELLLTVESMARIYSGMMGGALNGEKIDTESVRAVFNQLDRNGDGTITLDEYKKGMKRHPEFVVSLQATTLGGMGSAKAKLQNHVKETESMVQALKTDVEELERLVSLLPPEHQASLNDVLVRMCTKLQIPVARTPTPSAPPFVIASARESPKLPSSKTLLPELDAAAAAASGSSTLIADVKDQDDKDPMPSATGEQDATLNNNYSSVHSARAPLLKAHDSAGSVRPSNLDSQNDGTNLAMRLGQAPKGSTVFFGHKNWDLVLNVMKGIQLAVGRSDNEAPRGVTAYDFSVKEKYTLVSGAEASHCRFVDYAPFVFGRLRAHFGIDSESYVRSIGPGNMLSNLMLGSLSSLAELGSEGKSGSFFYLSSDGRFLVKTVQKEEHKLLRHILHRYYKHMTRGLLPDEEPAPESLLTHIVGCHVVRLSKHSKTKTGAVKVYFVVMENVLDCQFDLDRRYDLKGSWVGRRTHGHQKSEKKTTLKDLDLIDSTDRLCLSPEVHSTVMASLRRDTAFLEHYHIIDYSLLLGVHTIKESEGTYVENPRASYFKRFRGGLLSHDGKLVYVMGVIDFLTQYNSRKMAERALKTMILLDRNGISVMPCMFEGSRAHARIDSLTNAARQYAKRFLNFIENEASKKP